MKRSKLNTIIALVLLLTIGMQMSVFAVTDEQNYAGNQLRILGILQGYPEGGLKLDQSITRAEVATLAVRILGYEGVTVTGTGVTFSDVPTTHWAHATIQNAFKLSVINGYPDKTFKPSSNITYAEVVAILINALGQNKDLEGAWPNNYLNKAKALGLIAQNDTTPGNKIVTRGEMALLVYDSLLIKQ